MNMEEEASVGEKPAETVRTKPKKAHKTAKKTSSAGHISSKKQEKLKKRRRKTIYRITCRALLFFFSVLAVLVLGAYSLLDVIFNGPSATAGDILTISLLESSAGKFVPYIFYSEEEVAAIQERNKLVELEEETDVSLIVIAAANPETQQSAQGETAEPVKDIAVEEITGATYHGWMMIVQDPSRVMVGVSRDYFTDEKPGKRLGEIAQRYEAVAAINGGAFSDAGGQGNGGMPSGLTISGGELRNSKGGADRTTVGFDENNVLIVGKFTRDQAVERGLRDAVSFGPALVVNGEAAQFEGVSSGLNPRTAIGQRADGAVLMLVIDGRQVNSLGASLADVADVMVRYGAVNACNLDGGSSSNIYYEGEILNDGVALTGSRDIPTAFIVR